MTVAEFQQHLKDALAATYHIATDSDVASAEILPDGPLIKLSANDSGHTQFMTKFWDEQMKRFCSIEIIFDDVKVIRYEPAAEEEEDKTCEE